MTISTKTISVRTIRILNNDRPRTEQSIVISRIVVCTRTISVRIVGDDQLIARTRVQAARSRACGATRGAWPDRVA